MARTARRVLKLGLVIVIVAAVVMGAASSDVRVRRRIQFLSWKLTGSLPYVNLRELWGALWPSRLKSSDLPPGYFVREKEQGEEPCPVLWETPLGTFWGQRKDNLTLQDPRHLDRYERGPVAIHSGDVVVDIGSQIGTFTRMALGKGASRVVSIEPDPTDSACFKRTFQKEIAEGRVVLVEAALWERSGTTKFVVASRSDAGAIASKFDPRWGADRVIDVPTTSLDDTVQRLNLARVDFVKWAIGAATGPALRGARETLSHFRPRMAILMVKDTPTDDPVALPRLARQAVPTYNVFTYELQLLYFY
ncbi:MAG: FkbM family methyltransferase [Terriglobia bacterium]